MSDKLTKEEMKARWWHTYYNDDYWVHPDLIADPTRQDYTNYGMSFENAVLMESMGKPKLGPLCQRTDILLVDQFIEASKKVEVKK